MAINDPVTNADQAAERIQELLTQARLLVKEAAGIGEDWDLEFQFLDTTIRPDRDIIGIEDDFYVEEWYPSSPLC